jgi:DNA/RNA endonuclease G (NUC1)
MVSSGSADWRNYRNSGFDKGHLCPAADMEFNVNAYNETFLTSNIAPQDHNLTLEFGIDWSKKYAFGRINIKAYT